MTGIRRRIAQGMVATILLCDVGFMICGSMSSPSNFWERACIVLVVVMLGSMLGAVGLAAVTYLKLRADVRSLLDRPPLTDAEFIAMLADPATVDPKVVVRARVLAADHFRSMGGDRFYPRDPLNEDLHLRDLAPFVGRAFFAELEQALGIEEDGLRARAAAGRVTTFAELIAAASALADSRKEDDGLAAPRLSIPP